ncbi:hypothetical protein BCR24_16280 [Enterococcus ureilyticus]|uniref:Uncharacterized protein n=1 Tax=Enterococcus ureilyticus TaxID=1131292 RepID=A0A1E5HAH5_9ENTE|nr:hypothetical protein [Enterococcus ureilyticus]MBM7690594.1 hypothetical protein [Enterococcus ureilyticus]OEG21903.1 hypothetical protein BCR24_16280 [Enterococcus ureilyticus]
MNTDEINTQILAINNYLKKCLWMDFEFARMDGGDIVVAGRIDTSYDEFAINIEFGEPFYISSLLSWHLDDSKPFIEVVDGDEKQIVDDKYQVEQGNYIFKINAEDFEKAPIIIASKSIKCEIVNEKPF